MRKRLASAAAAVVALSACANIDSVGYRLPDGDLIGTQAFIRVVGREELQAMASERGMGRRHGSTVNGLSRWIGEPGSGCLLRLHRRRCPGLCLA